MNSSIFNVDKSDFISHTIKHIYTYIKIKTILSKKINYNNNKNKNNNNNNNSNNNFCI